MSSTAPRSRWAQPGFDDLGRPLHDVTFCVVDLETTGGSPATGSRITEIGAVKVRGGQVLGEFGTLVDPDERIPAFITVLTGITDAMVVEAPRIAEVLPSFLEFARGCVLVAHNAPFDTRFLRHAAAELGVPWPAFEVLDTAVLARRVLLRDEVRNVKLSTLAAHVRSTTTPNHRALADARATVDVLHFLFERLGSLGVGTLEDAREITAAVSADQRRRRHLADHLPAAPGVYLFRDRNDDVLYVGTSGDLRSRVRSYFTRSETRSRMGEMVRLTERIDGIVCATALEAEVRELRLIAAHRPPYNRRSKFPERLCWVRLTREPWPRLSVVQQVTDDGDHIGPFHHRSAALEAVTALHEVFRIRQCAGRLARRSRRSACALAEMDRCLSPCDGAADEAAYAAEVQRVRHALMADPVEVVEVHTERMLELAGAERFEEAAARRDRLHALLRGADRAQRLRELTSVPELVVAARHPDGWEMHVVRHGRLAAAAVMPRGVDHHAWLDLLLQTAESVEAPAGPGAAALVEETEAIRRWMTRDGTRLVRGSWTAAAASAARHVPERA